MSRLYRAVKRVSPGFVWRPLRRALHDFATEAGYHRERLPCDFRGLVDDPFEALERANGHRVLMDLPLSNYRMQHAMAYPLTGDTNNPFVLTARWLREQVTDQIDDRVTPLAVYLREVTPQSTAELLGIENSHLQQLSPHEAALPWEGCSGRSMGDQRARTAQREAEEHGFTLDQTHGRQLYGPASRQKIELEHHRFQKLLESIDKRGFQVDVSQAQITGHVLVNDGGDWRFLVIGGNHRAAVAAALDFPTVPAIVRPDAIYWRSDAHQWPGVIAADMDKADAINLFDRIFSGRQPGDLDSTWKPQAERFKREL